MNSPDIRLVDRETHFHEQVAKVEKEMGDPSLSFIIWEATKDCDINCGHCFNPREDWIPERELKTNEIKRFFWEIAQDFDAHKISVGITGGEPTLRKDLSEVVRYIHKLGYTVTLSTNGYLLGKKTKKIDELIQAGVGGFAVSLDGMGNAHNNQRGVHCFEEAIRVIKYLRKNHPDIICEVATVVTKYNYRDLQQVYSLLEHLDIEDWKFATAVPIKRAKDNEYAAISDFDFEKLLGWIRDKGVLFTTGKTKLHPQFVDEGWCGREYEGRVRSTLFFCYAGIKIASILYDGKVGVCLEVPRELSVQGDLRKERFSEIWRNRFQIFRNREWLRKDKCALCSEWQFCRGGAMHQRTSQGKMIQCSFLRLQKIEKRGQKREILIDSIDEIRIVRLFPLVITRQEEGYIVGREEIGTYAQFPEVGVETIRALQRTPSVTKVQNALQDRFGEEFDVQEFVRKIAKGGFVSSINDQLIETPREEKVRSIFNNVSQRSVKWMFSKPASAFYLVFIALGLSIMLFNPRYFPRYSDFFVSQRYTIIGVVGFLVAFLLMFKHELAHLFAARAYGVNSRIRLNNRLMYIVMETDLSNLWLAPKKKRMTAYIAGTRSDLMTISLFVILLYLKDTGGFEYLADTTGISGFLSLGSYIESSIFYRFVKLVIFLSALMVVFQFMFYMRTDVYYMVAHGLDCKNLYEDARRLLKNGFRRIGGRKIISLEGSISSREMRIIKCYAFLHFVGVALVILLFLYFFLPITIVMYIGATTTLFSAMSSGSMASWVFLDSLLFISFHLIYFVLLGYFALRKVRKHEFKYVTEKPADITKVFMSTVRCPKCSGLFGVEMFSKETQCPHCGITGRIAIG
jgi:radical SAM protein with 4Fe4S-binding SPASM domain